MHILLGSQHLWQTIDILPTDVAVVGNLNPALLALFGSDKHYAIGSSGTVDGARSCILQHVNAIDVGRVEIVDVTSHAVYNIKRCRAAVGTGTTDGDLKAVARLTGVGLDVHTRSFALQSAEHLRGVHLFDIVALDLYSGTGDEFLLLYTITDNDHILKGLVIGLHRNGKVGLVSHCDFLRFVANV